MYKSENCSLKTASGCPHFQEPNDATTTLCPLSSIMLTSLRQPSDSSVFSSDLAQRYQKVSTGKRQSEKFGIVLRKAWTRMSVPGFTTSSRLDPGLIGLNFESIP